MLKLPELFQPPRLQSRATTALSLPDGELAVQDSETQDQEEGEESGASKNDDAASIQSSTQRQPADDDGENLMFEVGRARGTAGLEIDDADSPYISDVESELDEEEHPPGELQSTRGVWAAEKKHFFILTAAGKPVYSRHGEEGPLSDYMGVLQTIISFFAQNDDPLYSFVAGRWKFSIVSNGPIYLVAASCASHESEFQLRIQLDALYTQILSTLTLTQVQTVFSRREGFDLRRLLGGTEVFLDGLADSMTLGNPSVLFGSIECVKIRKHQREAITSIFLKNRAKSLLYGLMIAIDPVLSADSPDWGCGRLISVIRPKRHSLHPPDLQLVFSMLSASATFRDVIGSEHWTPLCLPKFNAEGFLYAYISCFNKNTAVILLSPDKSAFFEMKECKEKFLEECEKKGVLKPVYEALELGRPAVPQILSSVTTRSNLSTYIPYILHFLYKSKPLVQFFTPAMPNKDKCSRRQVMAAYSKLYDQVHGKSQGHVKYVEVRVSGGNWGLAWIAKGWELYLVVEGPKKDWRDGIGKVAAEIVKWASSQEERIFVVGGGVSDMKYTRIGIFANRALGILIQVSSFCMSLRTSTFEFA